jgi:molybdopterin synthase sulfur carrier subunit
LSGNLKLVFFARLREDLGTGAEQLTLPPGVSTVAGLRAHLVERGGSWAAALAQGKAIRVAVNQEMAQPGTPVKPGDEVAFFPPVTGG